jgi:hypothetical protein
MFRHFCGNDLVGRDATPEGTFQRPTLGCLDSKYIPVDLLDGTRSNRKTDYIKVLS